MKIALVSEHASPLAHLGGRDAGGQNVYVAAIAGQLARLGHEVTVFTRRDAARASARVEVDGYVVENVSAGPPAPVPKAKLLPYIPEFTDRLYDRLLHGRFDLVHAHFWMSGLAAQAAAAMVGIPVVQTFHALGSVRRRHQGARDDSPAARVDLERMLCRSVSHIIATCRDEVEELVTLGASAQAISTIPCGVDTTVFRPARQRPEPDLLLALGRLVERKGVGDVIAALSRLPSVRLVVAGGPAAHSLGADPDVAELRARAEEEGVADRVEFLGSVRRDRVPGLIARSSIVVCAPWYEPFGIVPVEAMACGRPVVGTATGGLLDTIDAGVVGELVPPRRPDLLAESLRSLLADPGRQASYGNAGRAKVVREYEWGRVAGEIEAVYADVVTRFRAGTLMARAAS